jgi:glycosyltransferase involved in cell wall biosynthesis
VRHILVDVIVPTNRLSRFLPAALASVREQRYRDWRILIVDDGSGAAEEIDRLAAAVPGATVIHREHAGVSAARNVAIRAGGGEFVAFLDDDDVWPPDRLGELVAALAAHPSAAGAFGSGRYIDREGHAFGAWTTKPASQADFLTRATPIPRLSALLVRRTALDCVGLFDEEFAYSEDDELILRLLRHAPLVSSGTVVVDYRRHDHNVTLADWRTRYRSGRAAVMSNLVAARRLGEAKHVAELHRYLRRLDASTAGGSTGRVIGELKARRFRAAALDIRDSMRIAPLGFMRGSARTLVTKARSRMRSWLT